MMKSSYDLSFITAKVFSKGQEQVMGSMVVYVNGQVAAYESPDDVVSLFQVDPFSRDLQPVATIYPGGGVIVASNFRLEDRAALAQHLNLRLSPVYKHYRVNF